MPISTFLNGRAPTTARGLLFMALDDTAIIQTRSFVSDSGGGGTVSWAASGTVACRVAPLFNRPMSRLVGAQIDERSTHVLITAPDVLIGSTDRVIVSNRGTYEITGVRDRTDALTNVFEVIRNDVDPGFAESVS